MKKSEFTSKHGIGYDILKKYVMGENTWAFTIWREIVRLLGRLCVFSFYLTLIIFLYSFYFDTCKLYYMVYREKWVAILVILSGLAISFNVVFNYTFAAFLSPGNTTEFKDYTNEDYIELKNRLSVDNLNFCKKCETLKPVKSHHCSICKHCIIRKDHHNAWINNCVGYQNQRYFLLFLFYFQIMILGNLALAVPIIFNEDFLDLKPERTGLYPYVIIGSIIFLKIALILSIWQYFLLCKGETTYEYLRRKLDKYEDAKYKSTRTFRDIIYMIFGTKWLSLICFPSIRKLPYDGVNWDPDIEVVVQYLNVNQDMGDSTLGVMNE